MVQRKQTPVHVPERKKLFTVPFVPLTPLIGIIATEHVILGAAYRALCIYLV